MRAPVAASEHDPVASRWQVPDVTADAPPSCDYEIGRSDRIVAVGGSWLEFARENGAAHLTRERVVGRPLWEFVQGRETRELYEAIFGRVRRTGAPVSIPFRCDSPERFRFMRLDIVAAEAEGALELRGTLLREQERPFFSVLDRAFPRSRRALAMCSVCKRVQILGTHWVDAEEAVRRLDLFDAAEPPRLQYTVCDDCGRVATGSGAPGGAV